MNRKTFLRFLTLRKGEGLSGTVLKWIAVLSMTLDHFAVIIIQNGKLYGYSEEYYQLAVQTAEGQRWLSLYHVLRLLGRLAFPLFAFLIVEGFLHTSDVKKYMLRLLGMAVLSEVPFDLAFYNEFLNYQHQNIGFTLLISLVMLYLMKKSRRSPWKQLASVLGCAAVAELCRFDYGALGVLLVAVLYEFEKDTILRDVCFVGITGLLSWHSFFFAVLSLLPISFYSGERGSIRHSGWFYAYYPLHILFFYLLIYFGTLIS